MGMNGTILSDFNGEKKNKNFNLKVYQSIKSV